MADGTGSRRPYKNYLDQDVDLIDFDEEDSCKLLPRSTAHNRKRKASRPRSTVVETDSELESDELDLESMISTCSSSSTPTTINIRHDREDELDHEEADREHQANFVSGSAHDNAENTDTGPDDHDDGTDHGAMPMDGAVPVAMDPVPELIEEESHNVHDAGPLHVPEEGGILGIILDEFHQLQNEADESDGGEFSEVEEPEADAGQCEPDAGHCQEDGGNIHVPGGDEPVSSEAESKFELAVINPSMVLGPVICGVPGTSVEVIRRILERDPPAIPKLNFPVCDVRDVAKAHVVAMTHPDAPGHRHIVSPYNMWFREMADVLREEFRDKGYKPPSMMAPPLLLKMVSWFDSTVKYILPLQGHKTTLSNHRLTEVLGIKPYEPKESLIDMAYTCIDKGFIVRKKEYVNPKTQQTQTTEGASASP